MRWNAISGSEKQKPKIGDERIVTLGETVMRFHHELPSFKMSIFLIHLLLALFLIFLLGFAVGKLAGHYIKVDKSSEIQL